MDNPRNARTHSKRQIRQIANSVSEFGFTNPILIDGENFVLAGHGRLAAAKLLGMERVPCLRFTSMTDRQKRAYALADNKLALNAGWDEQLLAAELSALLQLDPAFDIAVTGFSISEVDSLIEGDHLEEAGDPADDFIPTSTTNEFGCQLGDVWELGHNRLICGDATNPTTIGLLMNGEKAQMVFTDPPYNVPIDGHVGGLGATKHREFAMGVGEMTKAEFTEFLRRTFVNLKTYTVDGSIHFVCMDWRHMEEILCAGHAVYDELKNLIVWAKDNGGMGAFYRSRHELIFPFKNGTQPHINSFELGQHGRYRTNVWQYRGVNTFKAGRMEELSLHPTAKPVQMVADAIKDVSKRNNIVLDVFAGSGSTLIAAEKTGRRAYLCEYDPIYCSRIIRRWQDYAKDDAVRIFCGLPAAGRIAAE
jgi:DNA modification methylase